MGLHGKHFRRDHVVIIALLYFVLAGLHLSFSEVSWSRNFRSMVRTRWTARQQQQDQQQQQQQKLEPVDSTSVTSGSDAFPRKIWQSWKQSVWNMKDDERDLLRT